MNQDDEKFVEEFVKKYDKLFEAWGLEKKTTISERVKLIFSRFRNIIKINM